ncbi:MAG: hypothetical protein OEZ58_03130 [Gammaproteobacteria bacterium]|nr:hypothetical protein [Gammaproteobacteria bacterium]MDH5727956.1 hypothetical protein [Gammaproteobacteria bacterium]
MYNSHRPSWTSPSHYSGPSRHGNYVVNKRLILYIGLNVEEWDVNFKERWHRVRFGFPIQFITIDFEHRKNQMKAAFEKNIYLLLFPAIIFALTIEAIILIFSKMIRKNEAVDDD